MYKLFKKEIQVYHHMNLHLCAYVSVQSRVCQVREPVLTSYMLPCLGLVKQI
jgi:hypothetical protein